MSDQEWTLVFVKESDRTLLYCGKEIALDGMNRPVIEALYDRIKLSLAAERERHGDEMTAVQLQLNKQFAAERENTQAAIAEGQKRIDAEHRRSEELSEDLNHMAKKSRQKDETLFKAVDEKAKLQEQLDAAREALRQLRVMRSNDQNVVTKIDATLEKIGEK
jgi:septal ring factor EnvC (AmiA/AmiB activator)